MRLTLVVMAVTVLAGCPRPPATDRPEVSERARAAAASEERPAPAKTTDSSATPEGTTAPAQTGFLLRGQVRALLDEQMPGLAFGLVVEIERGDRRAAIVWPAIPRGQSDVVDDDVVAFVFERSNGGWTHHEVSSFKAYGEEGRAKLAEALGGADGQEIIRQAGIPRGELAEHLMRHGAAFRKHLKAGEGAQATAAYERLTQAFALDIAAHDDALVEMLIGGLFDHPWSIEGKGDIVTFKAEIGGKQGQGTLRLEPAAAGVVIAELK